MILAKMANKRLLFVSSFAQIRVNNTSVSARDFQKFMLQKK